jgi:DNA-directed RNA polymerase specialized sigma24 family protein
MGDLLAAAAEPGPMGRRARAVAAWIKGASLPVAAASDGAAAAVTAATAARWRDAYLADPEGFVRARAPAHRPEVAPEAMAELLAAAAEPGPRARRARAVLAYLRGASHAAAGKAEGLSPVTVIRWERRFLAGPSGPLPRKGG